VVTHDQDEAMALSDRIAVMREGRIVQTDTPGLIYDCPINRYVADFIGDMNLFPASVAGLSGGRAMIAARGIPGTVTIDVAGSAGEGCWLALRPEKMRLAAMETSDADHWMPCQIVDRAHMGGQVAYRCQIAEGQIVQAVIAATGEGAGLAVGSDIVIGFRAKDAQLLGD
jgi:putrescine transport system ATP-binding protein